MENFFINSLYINPIIIHSFVPFAHAPTSLPGSQPDGLMTSQYKQENADKFIEYETLNNFIVFDILHPNNYSNSRQTY